MLIIWCWGEADVFITGVFHFVCQLRIVKHLCVENDSASTKSIESAFQSSSIIIIPPCFVSCLCTLYKANFPCVILWRDYYITQDIPNYIIILPEKRSELSLFFYSLYNFDTSSRIFVLKLGESCSSVQCWNGQLFKTQPKIFSKS